MGEHVDVLIVGAGLSGIGAAAQLARELPDHSYLVLESRDTIGGTWDLFRYPGVRSDSDMFTLGYRFKPWHEDSSLADADRILNYVRETAQEYDVDSHIRFGHRVISVDWSTEDAQWTVVARHGDTTVTFTATLLWACSGYYSYESGYTPSFAGQDSFAGQIIHPQAWPEDLDYAGKRVVVIGSGATAVTLVPAMASSVAHVTMLQRSPTYVMSQPRIDVVARSLRSKLGAARAYPVIRWKSIILASAFYWLCQLLPGPMAKLLRKGAAGQLPEGYDVDTHFKPVYGPWDQRLCIVPDGDLFGAVSSGKASVVTATIDRFVPEGVKLTSGEVLPADIIVTATGLNLQAFGGASVLIDGVEIEPKDTMSYKAMMLSGVPNFFFTIGYTNASWTLKADLVAEFVVRVLRRFKATNTRVVVPVRDPSVAERPFMDFEAGYVMRALEKLPKQGDRVPWMLKQNYFKDIRLIRKGSLDDGVLAFSNPRDRV